MAWGVAFVIGGQAAAGLAHFLIISAGVFLAGSFLSLLWVIAFYHGQNLATAVAYLVGGPVYVGFLLSHALVLRELGNGGELGRDWVLFALLVTFATDTGAFFVGRGKIRLKLKSGQRLNAEAARQLTPHVGPTPRPPTATL
jgi:CDP-diglyceride synthetase